MLLLAVVYTAGSAVSGVTVVVSSVVAGAGCAPRVWLRVTAVVCMLLYVQKKVETTWEGGNTTERSVRNRMCTSVVLAMRAEREQKMIDRKSVV